MHYHSNKWLLYWKGEGCSLLEFLSGGTKHATSESAPLLRLQSSEGNFTTSHEIEQVLRHRGKFHEIEIETSREIEPVRKSFRRRRSRASAKVANSVPSSQGWRKTRVVLVKVVS